MPLMATILMRWGLKRSMPSARSRRLRHSRDSHATTMMSTSPRSAAAMSAAQPGGSAPPQKRSLRPVRAAISYGVAVSSVDAVLLDAGGVLLLPTPAVTVPPLRAAGASPALATLRRAHYRATGAKDADGTAGWDLYRRTYAETCGVAPDRVEEAAHELGQVFDGRTWTQVAPGAVEALQRISAAGLPAGIVSNSVGTIAEMLEVAGVCQLGPGPCTEVAVIADSYLIGVEKPAPGIFQHALQRLAIPPERAVHVGDAARADVHGARAAGVRPIHLDPYGDCPDPPGDHEHVRDLGEMLSLVT